jgi:hypothetical protein
MLQWRARVRVLASWQSGGSHTARIMRPGVLADWTLCTNAPATQGARGGSFRTKVQVLL